MTTGEWIATVIGSNAFTLGLATFITNIMIKSSESKAKTANDIRDATIEKLETDYDSIEKELAKLMPLKDEVDKKECDLEIAKKDIRRLKSVVTSHGRQQKKFLNYIESQENEVSRLENKLLSLAEKFDGIRDKNASEINELRFELIGASRSIQIVKRTINKLKKEVEEEQKPRLMLE
ncbi:hypothetical protein V6257_01140 [Pseudoalteromonas issachenkonii]|uniref:Uncharacterized protein n=1 Tax=Pseudoalteromonas issachenkonii TaxID=152297 RepID=A0ABU9GVL0_9GAMM